MRAFGGILPLVLFLVAGCGSRVRTASSLERCATDVGSPAPVRGQEISSSIRFAIGSDPADAGPVFVLVNGEDSQVGWVRVLSEGQRVFLEERCEIEDCGAPVSVCGAAIPMIADLTLGEGSLEFLWDGVTSTLDPVSGCETRRPAAQGEFTARFCYSREAEVQGELHPIRGGPGQLRDPICTDIPFTLTSKEVVFQVGARPYP